MKRSLRFQLSMSSVAVVLLTVCVISLSANLLIQRQFDRYITDQQAVHCEGLADSIAAQYGAAEGGWNLDYIHGFGMYALNDGYIIKVTDGAGNVVWDAENHDMTLCHSVMNQIMADMRTRRPSARAQWVTHDHPLTDAAGNTIGTAEISYYTPNYANDYDYAFLRALNGILAATGLVALLAALLAGTLMARRIARPITAATELTRQISAGNYAIRLEAASSSRELEMLTDSVNQMAQDLDEQEARKRRLTTDVAHELRTPLANITAYLEAMAEGVWEPTPQRLKDCYDESLRISGIVAQLEALHRSEASAEAPRPETFDPLALCEAVRGAFSRQLEEGGQTCAVEGDACEIRTDRGKLHQILYNLVSNAVKYSPAGARITMTVRRAGSETRISVADEGIGIPAEELPRVFERFYRTDLSRSRKTGGAGIGLAIAKAHAEALGGRIEAESEVGRGSRFTVVLPDL